MSTAHRTGITFEGEPGDRKARAVCECGWQGRLRRYHHPATEADRGELVKDAKRHEKDLREAPRASRLAHMTTQTLPTVTRYEDHEGYGTCSACGLEGLRWIARLSDGSGIGSECAKKITGSPMLPAERISWVGAFEPIAEHTEHGETFVLWKTRKSSQTRTTRGGILVSVGGQEAYWKEEGWI